MTNLSNQGYLSIPASGSGPGVLVLHAWWGLNDDFRGFCDQLAKEGFVAFAPDLFAGTVLHTIEDAELHASQWDEVHEVPRIILPTLENLSKSTYVTGKGLGVVGFSMGGYWALWLALQKPELIRSVVLFYGTDGGGGNFEQSKAAFLGHFAEKDPYESESRVRELEKTLKSANRPVSFYTYPGTSHWFFEQDRPDAYHAQAARQAWERTVTFLKNNM